MTVNRSLTYVEIDIDRCALTYGVAPCTASIPATGAIKCFNSLGTCQDREHFDDAGVTLRFAKSTRYLPEDIQCLPSIRDVQFTPAVVSLGSDLGQRATLTVTFEDHRHSDTGPDADKYVADRDYDDPFGRGTFWGKFRARHPFLRGRPLRLIRGVLGQTLAQMETRHYLIESFSGPTPDGVYTLIASDALKLADGDRAQAPVLSKGFLLTGIGASDLSAILSPAGIGNAEYPAGGVAAIGGKEIVGFVRSGDNLTFTSRGQHGTVARSHSAQDRVQVCFGFSPFDPGQIIAHLLRVYAGVPAEYIDDAAWLNETQTFLGTLYSAIVPEPTPVNQLISELIEQAALAMWWDDSARQIRLQVLRAIGTNAARFTEGKVLRDSLQFHDQPDKRISQVWTYYGQINPLEPLDNLDNYRSVAATVALQAETDYGSSAIKKIFSRWIPAGGRSIALRLNEVQLGRFRDPPRRFSFDLMRYAGTDPTLGGGYRIESKWFQDATGAPIDAPIQVTSLDAGADRYQVEAEEMLFSNVAAPDPTQRVIIVDFNVNNINVRSLHDALYPLPQSGDVVLLVVQSGVRVGSVSTSLVACDVGSWPAGVTITLRVEGRIQGAGGAGGSGGFFSSLDGKPGGDGGIALFTRRAINLDVQLGAIWGGGGGGGGGGGFAPSLQGGGGGGGAGTVAGSGGAAGGSGAGAGSAGDQSGGGAGGAGQVNEDEGGGAGGAGGNAGQPGAVGTTVPNGDETVFGGAGGAAGAAIDGRSFVTITQGPGDRRGPEIN